MFPSVPSVNDTYGYQMNYSLALFFMKTGFVGVLFPFGAFSHNASLTYRIWSSLTLELVEIELFISRIRIIN